MFFHYVLHLLENILFLFQYRAPEVASRQNLLILNNIDTANEQHQIIPRGNFQSTVTRLGEKKPVTMAKVCERETPSKRQQKLLLQWYTVIVFYFADLVCRNEVNQNRVQQLLSYSVAFHDDRTHQIQHMHLYLLVVAITKMIKNIINTKFSDSDKY